MKASIALLLFFLMAGMAAAQERPKFEAGLQVSMTEVPTASTEVKYHALPGAYFFYHPKSYLTLRASLTYLYAKDDIIPLTTGDYKRDIKWNGLVGSIGLSANLNVKIFSFYAGFDLSVSPIHGIGYTAGGFSGDSTWEDIHDAYYSIDPFLGISAMLGHHFSLGLETKYRTGIIFIHNVSNSFPSNGGDQFQTEYKDQLSLSSLTPVTVRLGLTF